MFYYTSFLINLFNVIYCVALIGLISNRNNILLFLISVELTYVSVIVLYAISCSKGWGLIENQSYCLILLILIASESVTGLAILINCFDTTCKITFSNNQLLHG